MTANTSEQRHRLEALRRLAERPETGIAEVRSVSLPGNVPPWSGTGVKLAKGEQVTLLAAGRVVTAEALGLWLGPTFALWARVGGRGPLGNPPRDTLTLTAERDGELELATYQGEWGTPDGELATPVEAYAGVTGGLEVIVIRWAGEPERGLAAVAASRPDDDLVTAELGRLREPVRPPAGWRHLWFLGETEIFRPAQVDGSDAIHVCTRDDVGILQKPIDFELAADTRLSWRWRVSELPGREAENAAHLHDYLSLALEFDNGLDLTWYWSAALPVGTHYACPLPTWAARETHLVVRSGSEGLGAWQAEQRPVLEDYRRCIAPEAPGRIVAVWLIAVSLFGHRRGEAHFADIELSGGGRQLRVV